MPANAGLKEELLGPTVRIYDINAMGTGVVIEKTPTKTLVLTAAHVVSESRDLDKLVQVYVEGSTTVYLAKIVKYNRTKDLALLELIKGISIPTPVAVICNVEADVFDEVIAVGAGLGMPIYPTWGIVSNPNLKFPGDVTKYIQHTAFLAPGNSGGPLFYYEEGLGWCVQGINDWGMSDDSHGYKTAVAQINGSVALSEIKEFLKTPQ